MSDLWLWLVPAAMAVSVGTLIAAMVGLPLVLARLPADWFVEEQPVDWGIGGVLRNLAGAGLIVAGVIMLFTPGQGLLTLLAGVVLSDVPGKRHIALALLRRRAVLRGANWIRSRAGAPPLQLP